MSVLDPRELEASPLADLHAIAAELGLEGFRRLRKDDLIKQIVAAQGGAPASGEAAEAETTEPEEPDADADADREAVHEADPAQAAPAREEPEAGAAATAEPEPAAEPGP